VSDDKLIKACALGARTALVCSELVTLAIGLIPHVKDPEVARRAFDEVRRINEGLRASVEAFDSDEASQ